MQKIYNNEYRCDVLYLYHKLLQLLLAIALIATAWQCTNAGGHYGGGGGDGGGHGHAHSFAHFQGPVVGPAHPVSVGHGQGHGHGHGHDHGHSIDYVVSITGGLHVARHSGADRLGHTL